MIGSGFISDTLKGDGADVLWTLGAVAGALSAYAAIKRVDEKAAKVVAFPIWVTIKTVVALLRIPRWVWRQVWRGADGVSRGPMTRLALRITAWLRRVIQSEVAPMFAKNHQRNLDIEERLTHGFNEINDRLDRGSEVMREHGDAIAEIQKTLTNSGPVPIIQPTEGP